MAIWIEVNGMNSVQIKPLITYSIQGLAIIAVVHSQSHMDTHHTLTMRHKRGHPSHTDDDTHKRQGWGLYFAGVMPPLFRHYKTSRLTSDSWAEGKKRGASLLLSLTPQFGVQPRPNSLWRRGRQRRVTEGSLLGQRGRRGSAGVPPQSTLANTHGSQREVCWAKEGGEEVPECLLSQHSQTRTGPKGEATVTVSDASVWSAAKTKVRLSERKWRQRHCDRRGVAVWGSASTKQSLVAGKRRESDCHWQCVPVWGSASTKQWLAAGKRRERSTVQSWESCLAHPHISTHPCTVCIYVIYALFEIEFFVCEIDRLRRGWNFDVYIFVWKYLKFRFVVFCF